jgi:hypothetical protein
MRSPFRFITGAMVFVCAGACMPDDSAHTAISLQPPDHLPLAPPRQLDRGRHER